MSIANRQVVEGNGPIFQARCKSFLLYLRYERKILINKITPFEMRVVHYLIKEGHIKSDGRFITPVRKAVVQ